jgi:hypothetical protein
MPATRLLGSRTRWSSIGKRGTHVRTTSDVMCRLGRAAFDKSNSANARGGRCRWHARSAPLMKTSISRLVSKIATRVRRDGFWIASRYYFGALKHGAHYLAYDRRWDRLEFKRTGAAIWVPEDDIVGPNQNLETLRYQAFPRLPLLWSIQALGIDPKDYTFIDYGSGRGRMLLTAARLPFRQVIGVEFSRSLHNDAEENIISYPEEKLASLDVISLNTNAVDFDPPEGNFVAFFYNPFTGDILDRVADRIEAACRASPRDVYVIFANSDRVPLFVDRPSLKRFKPSLLRRVWLAATGNVPIEFFRIGKLMHR